MFLLFRCVGVLRKIDNMGGSFDAEFFYIIPADEIFKTKYLFAPSNTTKTVFVVSTELLKEFCFLIHETAVNDACVHFYK